MTNHLTTLNSLNNLPTIPALSGETGLFRAPETPHINANTDLEAIDCWLALFEKGGDKLNHTHESYKREAERLLTWAVAAKSKALSSLDVNDMKDYREFLLDPQPAALWIGRKHKKNHKDWRPFTGPLSERSAAHAMTVISNLFKFLVKQHYLIKDPCDSVPRVRGGRAGGTIDVEHCFSASQWAFITESLKNKVELSGGKTRLKWLRTQMIVLFLYVTGLRIHEVAKAKLVDIVRVERKGVSQYWLTVIGKGNKLRKVPIPQKTYLMINAAHLELTGKSIAESDGEYPIIPPLKLKVLSENSKVKVHFLTRLAIHKILKEFFGLVSIEMLDEDPDGAHKLSLASTHWLRHTHGTHAVDMDIALTIIRDNMGHASITTTSLYVHADLDDRHSAIDRMDE